MELQSGVYCCPPSCVCQHRQLTIPGRESRDKDPVWGYAVRPDEMGRDMLDAGGFLALMIIRSKAVIMRGLQLHTIFWFSALATYYIRLEFVFI